VSKVNKVHKKARLVKASVAVSVPHKVQQTLACVCFG
jgi:hypothetical protein